MSLVCEEAELITIEKEASIKMFAVFYACVIETEDDGIFVDSTYFGGIISTRNVAEILVRDITNDKNIQGAVMSKVLSIESVDELQIAHDIAQKHFNHMARDMYAMEDMNQRGRKK